MDRLISEQKVLEVINNAALLGRFDCGKERTIDEIKAIPSAEPKIVPIALIKFDDDMLHELVEEAVKNIVVEYDFKGMTNGQVHDMLYQMLVDLKDGADRYGAEYWWNSPYSEERSKND